MWTRDSKNLFCKKTHIWNSPSCIQHQVSGLAHVDKKIDSFLKKNNYIVSNAWKDFSIEVPISNIFFSSSNLTSSIIVTDAMVLGINYSKHTIKRGITTLALYLDANRIAFLHSTKLSTVHKALKCGSNMITIVLWTCHASKDFKKSKKGVITFITLSHIFLYRSKILASKEFKNFKRVIKLQQLSSHVHSQCDNYCQDIRQQLVALGLF